MKTTSFYGFSQQAAGSNRLHHIRTPNPLPAVTPSMQGVFIKNHSSIRKRKTGVTCESQPHLNSPESQPTPTITLRFASFRFHCGVRPILLGILDSRSLELEFHTAPSNIRQFTKPSILNLHFLLFYINICSYYFSILAFLVSIFAIKDNLKLKTFHYPAVSLPAQRAYPYVSERSTAAVSVPPGFLRPGILNSCAVKRILLRHTYQAPKIVSTPGNSF